MTHDNVIDAAVRHVLARDRAVVLLREYQNVIVSEQPDVWAVMSHGMTLIVEAKVSWTDFRRDAKKPWRVCPSTGMGDYRYYAAPAGLLRAEDLPQGWGLLEVQGNGSVTRVRPAEAFEQKNHRSETRLLLALLRRASFVGDPRPLVTIKPTSTSGTPDPRVLLLDNERESV